MKLRKALDKATRARQKSELLSVKRKQVVIKEPSDQGWVAPVYSDSVQAKLDPQFARENRFVCAR